MDSMDNIEKILDGNCTRMLRAILNKPASNNQQNGSCKATYHPFRRPSKLDE